MTEYRITSDQTIDQIKSIDCLKPAASQISLGEQRDHQSIDTFCRQNPDWLRDDMVAGLNRLLQIGSTGEPYVYPLEPEPVSLVHFPVPGKAPFVLICAGGAYCSVAATVEAFPIATKLNQLGYHAFSLKYRTGQEKLLTAPMEDLANAIRYIHAHGQQLGVDTQNYAVCGMSAGGHLAGTLLAESFAGIYGDLPKPAAVFLGYPVVSMGPDTHTLSGRMLLGEQPAESTVHAYSIDRQIHAQTPPVYFWQCREDAVVPFRNSQLLQAALEQHQIPHCYRIFEGPAHGWGLGGGTAAEGWVEEAAAFWMEHSGRPHKE